jgi:hypothetical protein
VGRDRVARVQPVAVVPPRVLQISRTDGQACGIAYFARNLHEQLLGTGVTAALSHDLTSASGADVVVIHHHWDLFADDEINGYCKFLDVPVVLFGHEPGIERFAFAAGFATMSPGHPPRARQPVFTAMHPAWLREDLVSRSGCRPELGLPPDRLVVGSSGFIRFERNFPEIVDQLLPVARERGWFVELLTSPWKEPSPGVVEQLTMQSREFRDSFRFTTRYLSPDELNLRLQACDLLWSWTSSPSRAYASGAISDQYASGTRIFACRKRQYEAVLSLPNTVTGAIDLGGFVTGLIAEARQAERHRVVGGVPRHDPSPVSWGAFTASFISFLGQISAVRQPGQTQQNQGSRT